MMLCSERLDAKNPQYYFIELGEGNPSTASATRHNASPGSISRSLDMGWNASNNRCNMR